MSATATLDRLRAADLRPPRALTLAVTAACNLRCRHCWVDAGASLAAAPVPEAILRRLLDQFAALGGEEVCFTGGEPLCHPHWRQLLAYARTLGFPALSLQTNGMLLRSEDVAALRRLDFPGLKLQISLDGATAPAHDLVRGAGAFREVVEALRLLAAAGLAPRLTLFFTEMRHNLAEIPAVLELAEGFGIGAVVAGTLVRCGRASAGSAVAPPAPAQYEDLLRRFDADPGFRSRYQRIGQVAALEWHKGGALRPDCCAFVENPYLTSRGILYPCVLCHADDFAVSGVLEKGLPAALVEGIPLWTSLQRISERRRAGLPECRHCPIRTACAGGCLGRAWGSSGDLLAADDRCEARQAICRLHAADPVSEG